MTISSFPSCGPEPLHFYPVVDSSDWVAQLLPLGVKTIQLRVKNKQGDALEADVARAVALANFYQARLFVNDYWELALKHQAYGVHLGQEDLNQADYEAIRRAGIRLGISTHSDEEVARADQLRPSYLAFGPIYHTTAKKMAFGPQGVERLQHWVQTLNYPWVAIGGINLERLPEVLATGVNGVAVISAVTQASDPEAATRHWLQQFASI